MHGKATGSKIKVLHSQSWLNTLNYYDLKGRVLQTITDNHLGGQERLSNRYDWRGQVLSTQLLHTITNPLSGNVDSTLITEHFSYDNGTGLLLSVTHQVNEGAQETLSASEYNELAQVKAKKLVLGQGYGPFKEEHLRIANFPTHSKEQMEMLVDLLATL